jgi:hypothetical protein
VYTNVSEVPSASIIRAIFGPDDEGNKHLWNVGNLLPEYTALQPRRQRPSHKDMVLH